MLAAQPVPTRSGGSLLGRRLLGVQLSISVGSREHGEALESAIGHWPGSHDGHDPIRLRYDAGSMPLPDGPPLMDHAGYRQWVLRDDALVVADGERHRGVAYRDAVHVVGPPQPRDLERVLGLLLARPLVDRGRRMLHAAGLVDPNGRGIIALGTTGAGKSTLVASMLLRGWHVLADDLTAVRTCPGSGAIEAAGYPRRPAVPTEVAAGLRGEPIARDPRSRSWLDAAVLHPGWHPVAGVVLIGHGPDADADLVEVGERTIVSAVIESMLTGLRADIRQGNARLAFALSRLPAARLLHGTDASMRVHTTAQAMERFAAGLS